MAAIDMKKVKRMVKKCVFLALDVQERMGEIYTLTEKIEGELKEKKK